MHWNLHRDYKFVTLLLKFYLSAIVTLPLTLRSPITWRFPLFWSYTNPWQILFFSYILFFSLIHSHVCLLPTKIRVLHYRERIVFSFFSAFCTPLTKIQTIFFFCPPLLSFLPPSILTSLSSPSLLSLHSPSFTNIWK